MLRVNKELKLMGVDLWEVIDGGAYKDNNKNEWRCRRKLKKYGDRFILLKGDAFKIAKEVKDQSFDFVFYDLQCKPMQNFHRDMIEVWLPKLKKGGYLIGRDFRAFRNDFYALGFKEEDFQPCTIGDRKSTRLEYLVIP
jgi:hypothetical protein